MSDAQIGSLLIKLQAQTAELDQQIKATRQNFLDLRDGISTVKDALAAFGVFEGIKSLIDTSAEAEKAQALLASQIKATGDASGLSLVQLEAMAQGFADTSTSSREKVEQLETELMAFRNIAGEQFKGAIQAALDFSAVTGRDATEAVRALGMALNDPAANMARLAKAGVDLDAATKFTIKSLAEQGDLIGAQNILLQKLQESYGGAAAAARDTLGGAIQGLKNDFNDLLQGNGGGVQELTDSVKDMDAEFKDPAVKQGIATLVAGVLRLAGVAAEAAANIAAIPKAFGEAVASAFVSGSDKDIPGLISDLKTEINSLQSQVDRANEESHGEGLLGKLLAPDTAPLIARIAQAKLELQGLINLQKTAEDHQPAPTATASFTDFTMVDPSKTDKIGAPIKPVDISKYDEMLSLVEMQRRVVQIWKQMDPASYIKDQIAEVDQLVGTVVNGQVFTQKMADTRIAQLEEEWKRHTDAMTEATQSAAQGMQQDLQQFFFDPVNEGLGGLLKAFVNTLREMLAQWAAAQLFQSAFGSYDKTGQGGGAAGFGDLMASFFGGHRAGGGPVSAGMLYQVNEGGSGTEAFVPSTGGSVIPLGNSHSAGSGMGDFHVSYSIDARGADGATGAQLLQMMPALRRLFHADVEHYASRGVWPA